MASSGATYSVFTTSRADRDLEKLPANISQRVLDAILALGDDPYPPGAVSLQGRDGHRIRVGDYQALYLVDETERGVTVFRVGHRQGIYG